MDYQVIVLGGGPGGYTAAIRCNQYGLKTALVEMNKLGGTCLNRGCIPTKAMLSSAELLHKMQHAASFGLTAENIGVNMSAIIDRKNRIVGELVGGLEKLFKMRKIEVFNSFGKLVSEHEIELADGTKISAENIIIATGSEPLELPFLKVDHKNIITSNEALNTTEIPSSMLVIGGGVVGSEFASMFNDFGTKVTIVEMLDSLVPTEDAQVCRTLQTAFKKKNIALKLKTRVTEVEIVQDGEIRVSFDDGSSETYAKVLVSVGRSLNLTGNGVDTVGIELTERKMVKIDDKMRTNIPHIYAIGDITGKMMLAHVAAAQGLVAAAEIAGKEAKLDYTSIPSAIFTTPEIASVGEREQNLKDNNIAYKVSRFNFAANGKAKGLGEEDGFVKILVDDNDKILGAHIIGPHASDLLQEITTVKTAGLHLSAITEAIHAHPTLSECVLEAAEGIHKMAIHSI